MSVMIMAMRRRVVHTKTIPLVEAKRARARTRVRLEQCSVAGFFVRFVDPIIMNVRRHRYYDCDIFYIYLCVLCRPAINTTDVVFNIIFNYNSAVFRHNHNLVQCRHRSRAAVDAVAPDDAHSTMSSNLRIKITSLRSELLAPSLPPPTIKYSTSNQPPQSHSHSVQKYMPTKYTQRALH